MNKDQAAAIIAKYADAKYRKDSSVQMLLSEARAAFRRGDYAAVGRKLSDQSIARQRSLY